MLIAQLTDLHVTTPDTALREKSWLRCLINTGSGTASAAASRASSSSGTSACGDSRPTAAARRARVGLSRSRS